MHAILKSGTTLLCLSVALANCSGSSSVPRLKTQPIPQAVKHSNLYLLLPKGQLPPRASQPPLPDPSVALLKAAHNPPSDPVGTAAFQAARRSWLRLPGERTTSNVANGAQQYGIGITGQSGILGMRGTHSAYSDALFVGYSQGVNEEMYAPTGKVANGCVEVGTENFPGSRPANVYAFDFCSGSDPIGVFTRIVWLDGSTPYVATINGIPSYTFTTLRNPDGHWTVSLYNFGARRYDPLYTSVLDDTSAAHFGSSMPQWQRAAFWDMFEPKFPASGGPCMGTPPVSSTGLAELTSNGWATIDSFRGASANESSSYPSCFFNDDGSGVGYYYYFTYSDLSDWSLGAYASQPTPPPPAGGCDPSVDPYGCCDPSVYSCCDPTLQSCCVGINCLPPCIGFNCACPDGYSGNSPNCGPGSVIYSVRRQPTSRKSVQGRGTRDPVQLAPLQRPPDS
ncbi:MAG: hypothetical protein JO083_08010 [Candidatus Eremiobacteraeota bacterium]|nr:hypothetical protein [Candidatus Eremiobacteraeota bacterium]